MMLLERIPTEKVHCDVVEKEDTVKVKSTESKRRFVFIAHYVENWNWLLPRNIDLNQHPEHARRWMLLWPMFPIISIAYLLGKKAYDQVDKFTFNDKLDGRIALLRNFGWQFFIKNQRNKIRARILQTVVAEQGKVDVIGLGALTKAEWLTAGGQWIVDELGDKLHVPVVHGDTLTSAALIKRCLEIVARYDIKSVFITGGTSKIGRALILYLASRDITVKLLTASSERFDDLRDEAGDKGKFLVKAGSLIDGHECRLWVTGKAVPAGKKLLRSIPNAATVVNFSVPNPINEGLFKKRPDLLFIEGGLLSFDPKISTQAINMRLNPGDTYACHAGTMVHAYKGWTHHEVGPVDMSTIWETWDVALELGFFLKPLSDLAGGEMSEPAVPTEGGHIIGIARKTISRLMRFSGFILVSLLLYWLFWGILALARVLKPFQYLFLVYPGTDSDLDAYCPRRIAKSRLLKNKAFIGGLISRGPGGRGLVLVTPSTIENFSQDGQARKEIMGRLEWIGRVSGAGAIALAGQLPGIIYRNGNSLQRPFVRGDRGTVFCVMETLDQIMKNHNLNRKSIRIAVVGVGHVGGILLDALRNEGLDTVGIDIELKRGGIVLQKEGERLLQDIDVVIVLTPRGNDFLPYLKFVKKDAIILDDTHPKIKQNDQPKNLTFYKVAVGIENTRFYPRLPGYRPNWIPGCVVDAMVAAATGNFNGIQQIEFNEMAKKLGFFALMVK